VNPNSIREEKMKKQQSTRAFVAAALAVTIGLLPVFSIGQTRISMPKNKYKVQDDIKLGNDAARQVERQFPLVNDAAAQRYVESVGRRLVAAIPPEFQQPAFDYRFEIVNASDINAFALPGGPMFVNRGMIEAAKNEGEMAGVMAHEMSHVALRHATAQQTKANNPWNQILAGGAVVGGAILGGEAGAQAGQMAAAGYFLKFSREYEKQADLLGARIMATAGYDPRDLANMFQTIERQGGSRAPQWLSDHPDPGNRFQYINQEASMLQVLPNPIKITPGFARTKEKFRSMPPAPTMQQIQQGIQRGQVYGNGNGNRNRNPTGNSPTSGGRYSNSVQVPSSRTREYSNDVIQLTIPGNWRDFDSGGSVEFAPEGGYGDQGITHGVMIGMNSSGSTNSQQATTTYVNELLQENAYLRQQGGYSQFNISGRQGYTTTLSGQSPVTGRTEIVTVYTAMLRNGQMLCVATVVPQDESYRYSTAFRNVVASISVND
jgi:beta-barrel assembly-enhancing protease